jgi:hypothetical protein
MLWSISWIIWQCLRVKMPFLPNFSAKIVLNYDICRSLGDQCYDHYFWPL